MIRLMRADDVAGAMRLKAEAGWNQTVDDWTRLIALDPDGCFVDERDGFVAGTATAIRFGDRLAWVGMVLVAREFRRRGIARGLMKHSLAWLKGCGVRSVKLDATDSGRPLYAQLGFADECAIERWERVPSGEPTRAGVQTASGELGRIERHFELDQLAFGADRSLVLRALAAGDQSEFYSSPGGYLLARTGSEALFLGPCVAIDVAAAAALLRDFLAKHAREPVFWDLLPANASATRLASSFGFQAKRRLTRMVLEDNASAFATAHPKCVYAAAGFEFG